MPNITRHKETVRARHPEAAAPYLLRAAEEIIRAVEVFTGPTPESYFYRQARDHGDIAEVLAQH